MLFSNHLRAYILKKNNNPLRVSLHTRLIGVKRVSHSASSPLLKEEDGSATVEAAMVIPLLLCAFLALLIWGKVFLLQLEMESALLETARQMARQEHLLTAQDEEGNGMVSLAPLFLTNREQGAGASGVEVVFIQFSGSEYREDTKEVHLQVQYHVKLPMMLLGTWQIPFQCSVTQKAWNGYAPPKEGEGTRKGYVYMTEYGETYHTNGQCYHLHVTIQKIEETTPFYEGETKYRPCEHCVSGEEKQTVLYVTEEGDCYHEDLGCSGLTRTVRYVEQGEVGDRRLCTECGS